MCSYTRLASCAVVRASHLCKSSSANSHILLRSRASADLIRADDILIAHIAWKSAAIVVPNSEFEIRIRASDRPSLLVSPIETHRCKGYSVAALLAYIQENPDVDTGCPSHARSLRRDDAQGFMVGLPARCVPLSFTI